MVKVVEMTLVSAIPVLPVSNVERAVEYYVTRLGFEKFHADPEYGMVGRDGVQIHVWAANKPDTAGAEPHLAGSASCRILVSDLRGLHDEIKGRDLVHPIGDLDTRPWGEEFAVLDLDRNAIAFQQAD